jgi:hypothetical protein
MIEEVHLFNLIDSRSVNFVHKATLTSSHLTDLDCRLVLCFNFVIEQSCGTHNEFQVSNICASSGHAIKFHSLPNLQSNVIWLSRLLVVTASKTGYWKTLNPIKTILVEHWNLGCSPLNLTQLKPGKRRGGSCLAFCAGQQTNLHTLAKAEKVRKK